jgi:CheY-like chemotaxis protein
MVQEYKNSSKDIHEKSTMTLFEKDRKRLELFSLMALSCLIVSVILISFGLNLIAGCFVIIAAALGIIVVRKAMQLLRKVRESLAEASRSSEKKDDVVTDFSHRIREPLNNLVIIGDLLIGSGLQKKQKDLLETFIASTNNMVTTVNELTMQSASNISYEVREKIRFNLISTIQNTIDLFSLKENANIDFILSRKDSGQFEISGDPIIIKQIFLDLFNTIERHGYERPTKVTINLKKTKDAANESYINFRVQTDRNVVLIDEKGVPGSLAAKLIYSGKGNFHQESGENYTVLDFTIPFLNVSPEVKKQITPSSIEELSLKEKRARELKDMNILLVEDNEINQKITILTLKPLVNRIDTAINGKEAIDRFSTSNYDVILMDIQMPVMDGLISAEKIRALEAGTDAHVHIIAITANAMLGDKEKCLSAGMDDYLSKPFLPSTLIEKIKKIYLK